MNNDKKIQYAIKLAKRLNQRYRNLEKKKLQYYSWSYEHFKAETNQDFKSKKGYYTQSKVRLSTFTDEQLENYLDELERNLKQKNTSVRQARKIKEESFKSLKEKVKEVEEEFGVQLTEESRTELLASGVLSIKEMDSMQIIEDWIDAKSDGVSLQQFILTYKEYQDKFVDKHTYTKVKRKLQSLGGNKK